ncbi:MAG TPA: hypothetical protein IAC25_06565 [Candidatus Enterenecus stercoripullorum]|nr:hypothetical protein [Candidatus Enterenecus stercoripullorum]
MKPKSAPKKPWQVTAYCGVFLALSLVLLVIAVLRTAGVVEGGPVPWYLWVSVLLGTAISLYGLLVKKEMLGYQRAVEVMLIVLYGGLLLFRVFRNGVPDVDSREFKILVAMAILLVLSPLLAAQNKSRQEQEAEWKEQEKRRREEELAELRRSMAPTKREGDQQPGGAASQDISGDGEKPGPQ